MTKEEFETLRLGDIVTLYGFNGKVVKINKSPTGHHTYDVKSEMLNDGDGNDVVTFAYNEGQILK